MPKFRRLVWMVIAAVGLILSASQSQAQLRQPDVGDQPGLIADDSVELDPEFRKMAVLYRTNEAPGTVIVQTAERHLYLVQGNGRALRYGIGVGREGFQWQRLVNIPRKAEWPDWTPPPEMIPRQPYLPRFMAGGPGNPLGARACISAPPCIAFTAPTGPTPWHGGVFRLFPAGQYRRRRPLRARPGRRQGHYPAEARTVTATPAVYSAVQLFHFGGDSDKGCTGYYSFSIRCILALFSAGLCFDIAGASDRYSQSSGLGW